MVKHTQTIRLLFPTNCLSVFDHFVGLALRGLRKTCQTYMPINTKTKISKGYVFIDVSMHILKELIQLNGIDYFGKNINSFAPNAPFLYPLKTSDF